jgi:hypothetical protein
LMLFSLLVTWCCLCIGPAPLVAQVAIPDDFKATVRSVRRMSLDEALEWMARSVRRHPGLGALASNLAELGFNPATSDKDLYGERAEFEKDQKTYTALIIVQNYSKAGSRDVAALGALRFVSGEREEQYNFCLIAPNGDLKGTKEYTVDKSNKVVATHNWWTCFRKKLGSVGGGCASATLTCMSTSGTFSGYLTCVSVPCRAATSMASSCCTCNCRFWCKSICGCCRQ